MRKRALLASAVLACGLGQAACTTNQGAQMQSDQMTRAEGADGDWTVYGGDLSNTRYVANDQINSQNLGTCISSGFFRLASSAPLRRRRSSRTA
jgi:glucose dehydrogenase